MKNIMELDNTFFMLIKTVRQCAECDLDQCWKKDIKVCMLGKNGAWKNLKQHPVVYYLTSRCENETKSKRF